MAEEGEGGMTFIDIDPNAPHDEDCGFWHGGCCTCKPEMRRALEITHCHECDFVHGSGLNRCICNGFCFCQREEGCPCIDRVPVNPADWSLTITASKDLVWHMVAEHKVSEARRVIETYDSASEAITRLIELLPASPE